MGATGNPVFTVGGTVIRWTDVAAFAKLRGVWDEIAVDAAAGVAALRREPPTDGDVDEAAGTFRRERGLLSADDLADWLERREVSVEAWLSYIRRTLVRGDAPGTEAPEDDVWAEGMCSGRLDECALLLARFLAVAPGTPLAGLDAAFAEFSSRVATDEAIEREIASARLDWMRVRYGLARFPTEAAAAEAVLCVREDGQELESVAATAGVEAFEEEVWLEEAEPVLAQFLVPARPGELVGPVLTEDGYEVAEVRVKTPVDASDPAVRVRAERAVIERAADRATTDHVFWHEAV